MATHTGSEGTVKVGSNAVGEITAFTVTETGQVIEDSSMGDTARTYKAGLKDATGSITVRFDGDEVYGATGQGELDVGSSVTLNLYPEGADTGDTYYTGTAIVTSKEVASSFDDVVSMSFEVQFSGGLTQSQV